MAIVEEARTVTGGVDTHLDLNVAAALDGIGGLLGVAEFPTTSKGHRELANFLAGFGTVTCVGVEGTGSYGAGLARFLRSLGVEVVEVDRPNRQSRRRTGKSDPADAVEAGPVPRCRGGPRERARPATATSRRSARSS
jgi:transposase